MLRKLITEIRNRIFLIMLTWSSVFLMGYQYKQILLFRIVKSNVAINYLITTDVTEIFLTYFKLNQFLANYFLTIYFCYHFFLFFISGLYYVEYTFFKKIVLTYSGILIFSILFADLVGISVVWSFFLEFQQNISNQIFQIYFETKLDQFLTFYLSFLNLAIIFALVFTFLIFFSIYINKNLLILKLYRKTFHFCLLIITILITPSDLFSFFAVSLVLLIVFELFLLFNFFKI
jgi:sec-independent protein translocase protein TatC